MNDLRIEDSGQQLPYAGMSEEPATFTTRDVAELRNIVLWLSKQPWEQPEDQTWEGLVKAYEKSVNPEPLPELPSRGYRIGK